MADEETPYPAATSGRHRGSPAAGRSSDPPVSPNDELPERYRVRESDDQVFLGCDEAPRIRVSVSTQNSFSESEAKELGERTILLDGAGTFGPVLDNTRRLYNLDHHEGCERAFTLATCEQALLLVHSGLELSEGDWTIYANEPDLDTVLAIWCLLNHQRLLELRPDAKDILLPMIRLEGAIDANGSELARICGLPLRPLKDARQRLDVLLEPEFELKRQNEWMNTDLLQFTLSQLKAIDLLIFRASDFRQYTTIDEVYGHTEISPRRVAVACRDPEGIYDVEESLKTQWGDQLLLIALEKEPGHYTLRRTTALSDLDLGDAYEWLNRIDPHVDGRPPGKRWGGSSSIGGSPRGSGTGLSPIEVLEAIRFAYQPQTPWLAWRRSFGLALYSLVLLVLGSFAGLCWNLWPGSVDREFLEPARIATFGGIATLSCWLAATFSSKHRTWLYGWRRIAGSDWLWLIPIPLLAGLPARSWVPQEQALDPAYAFAAVGAILLAALGTEFWFRGLVHGALGSHSASQRVSGPWHVSLATTVSSFFYAAVSVGASLWWVMAKPAPLLATTQELLLVFLSSLVGGFALAMIRERSLSLWPGVLVQFAAGILSAVFWFWLLGDLPT